MKPFFRWIKHRPVYGLLGGGTLIGGIILAIALAQFVSSQAAAREAWEERQQRVAAVIQSQDRSALIGTSPTLGNPNAQIILFEFSDFQCPYCAAAADDINVLMEKQGNNVLLVYKHLPLTQIHPEALPAARAAWAAAQQGQFWPYHDALFAQQARLGEALYSEIAQGLGLDMARFERDRTSPSALAAVEQDLAMATALGLNATPTFVMNDLLIPPGAPVSFIEETLNRIQAALADDKNP